VAYFNNSIRFISRFYPSLCWEKPTTEKIIYLTFDDGPVPGVTDFVLEQLEKFNAKATFFCVGENVEKHPDQFSKIIEKGHSFGNHTYNHIKGWNVGNSEYLGSVKKCHEVIEQAIRDTVLQNPEENISKNLFRPPYGKIKKSQINALQDYYKIIMWTVLTGDFDKKQSPESCLRQAIKYSRQGSIVIFHDSYLVVPGAIVKYFFHYIQRRFFKI